jgi:hypothetical protein
MIERAYKVDRVCYERVFNVGGYESIRIRLEAPVSADVDPGDVVRGLASDVANIYAGAAPSVSYVVSQEPDDSELH